MWPPLLLLTIQANVPKPPKPAAKTHDHHRTSSQTYPHCSRKIHPVPQQLVLPTELKLLPQTSKKSYAKFTRLQTPRLYTIYLPHPISYAPTSYPKLHLIQTTTLPNPTGGLCCCNTPHSTRPTVPTYATVAITTIACFPFPRRASHPKHLSLRVL
jgi:hypothetical protein